MALKFETSSSKKPARRSPPRFNFIMTIGHLPVILLISDGSGNLTDKLQLFDLPYLPQLNPFDLVFDGLDLY